MTTATVESVGEAAILRHQAQVVYRVVKLNLEGITHEESLLQPQPQGNCLNWVVGHLVLVYDKILPLLGQKPVMPEGALHRYDRGTQQLSDPRQATDLDRLLEAWDEDARRADAGLATLTAAKLNEHAPFSPINDPEETVRTLLAKVFFHQAYHAGQTGLLRRIAGKDGAIR